MKIKSIIILMISVVLVTTILIPICSESDTDKDTLEVILIAGQSNAEYGYDNGTTDPSQVPLDYSEVPTHNLYFYGTDDYHGEYRVNNPWHVHWDTWALYEMYGDNGWRIGGYEPIVANEIAKASGHDVLVLNVGVGNRTVTQLNPASGEYPGQYGKQVIETALSLIPDTYSPHMVGFMWLQGESDRYTPVAEYTEQFTQVHRFYASYGFEECFVIHTRTIYGGNANLAIERIASQDPTVSIATYITETFTEENGTLVEDGVIHYSQKGRDEIALAIKDNLYTAPESSNYSAIIQLIPFIVLAGLVLGAASVFIMNRD